MNDSTTIRAQYHQIDESAHQQLDIILTLLQNFEDHAVIYCYWKCSARVEYALRGEKDLDLLIAREDQHRVRQILLASGFKLFPSVFNRDHPAVLDYVGYDEGSGLLVHVHLHLRLIVGERLLKNYRLPWESELLARAVKHPHWPVRILDPASEALVLMVRACLEISLLDPLAARSLLASRAQITADLADLARTLKPEEFHSLADDLLGPGTAGRFVEALYDTQPLRHRRRLRRLLLAEIATHRLYNGPEARLRSLGRTVMGLAGRLNKHLLHAPRPWNRRAPGGGCVIAVVGLDGSGKSTIVRMLQRWLVGEVDVMPIYFGTGEGRPSLVLLPFKLLARSVEPLFKTKPSGSSHGVVTKKPPGRMYSVLMTVWATVVALEKRMKLVAARRAANRGMVVVADRYPQNEIQRFNDGPLLPRLPGVPGVLRRFEGTAYARAEHMPPDLVLKLVVVPETAMRREPTMDRAVIVERVAQLRSLAFPGAKVVCIDAEQSLATVIRAVKREVWNAL